MSRFIEPRSLPLAVLKGSLPLAILKIKIPAAFSARRALESLALLFLQAIQSTSRAGIIATAIISPTTMTSRISRLARGSASRPVAVRLSAQWERPLGIRYFNLKKWVALSGQASIGHRRHIVYLILFIK